VGDFVDVLSVHIITEGIIPQLLTNASKFFLVTGGQVEYNGNQKVGETMIIGIIGGGASGMAAALAAAENTDNQVLLYERQARLGRKLQATGNGRCNLSNLHAGCGGYHGQQPEFVLPAMTRFDPEETLQWFRRMGLLTISETSGRVYPYSDQANSVVDVLRFALEKPNIRVITGQEISKIRRQGSGFLLDGDYCDRLIIACGGLAGSKLGGTMSGYQLLRSLGHRMTKLRPALVQLKSSWNGVAALKGVRANCYAAVYQDGRLHSQSTGEIQFTEYGLSGPVIFEISRDACQGAGEWSCRLDLLPSLSAADLYEELNRRKQTVLPVQELLTGILHNRLGRVVTKAAGLSLNGLVSDLTDTELQAVCTAVKSFEVPLTEPMGMDSAQVTAGGIMTEDFDANTMHSKLVPGLYACGEVLDIDGDCGGYNLQWAWSSGRCAGFHAGKDAE
jgi:predicted Rossmann fold flavoprotein